MNAVGPPEALPRIHNVSDTAWFVAALRAVESERPNAHFTDPYARLLVADKGDAFLEATRGGQDMAWFVAVRTVLIDELVSRLVYEGGRQIDGVSVSRPGPSCRQRLRPTAAGFGRWPPFSAASVRLNLELGPDAAHLGIVPNT